MDFNEACTEARGRRIRPVTWNNWFDWHPPGYWLKQACTGRLLPNRAEGNWEIESVVIELQVVQDRSVLLPS